MECSIIFVSGHKTNPPAGEAGLKHNVVHDGT